MALAARIGSAYVLVRPSLKGFQAETSKGATKAATSAGKSAGSVMGRGMAAGASAALTASIPQMRAAAAKAGAAVAAEAAKYSAARDKQTAAASRLAIAEQRLVELRAKGNVTQSAMMSAEARVATAKAAVAKATDTATAAQGRYVAAMKASTGAQAALQTAMASAASTAASQGTSTGSRYITGLTTAIRSGTTAVTSSVRGVFAGAVAAATTSGQAAGRGFSGGMLAGMGPLAAILAPAAILKSGFTRLANIEDAQAQLTALGHSGAEVQAIMDNALASVQGTAFGMGDAAQLAGVAVAAGIEPGKDLERQLKLVTNTAAMAKTELPEMGSIFQKVWTRGRADTEVLNQVAERGIPIWTKLAEHYGVTGAELQKMVSAGKVDAETFAAVMEDTVGPAAEAMGNTTRGVFRNVAAAASRFGAKILEDAFPLFKQLGNGMITIFDDLTTRVEGAVAWAKRNSSWLVPFAQGLGVVTAAWAGLRVAVTLASIAMRVSPIGLVVTALAALVGGLIWAYQNVDSFRAGVDNAWNNVIKPAFSALAGFVTGTLAPAVVAFWNDHARPALSAFAGFVTGTLAPALKSFWENTARPALTTFGTLISTVWSEVIKPALQGLWDFLGYVGEQLQQLWTMAQPVLSMIGNAFVALWRDFISPALSLWWGYVTNFLAPVILWLWKNIVQPAFSAIGFIVKLFWEGVVKPLFAAWVLYFTKVLGPTISWLWNNVAKPIFDKFREGLKLLSDRFVTTRDAISKAWSSLANIVSKPITATIQWVNRHFLGGLESALNRIPGVKVSLPRIAVPGAVSGSQSTTGGLQKFNRGGLIPGPWRGPFADNVLGVTPAGMANVRVNPREYIQPVRSVDDYGVDAMDAVRDRRATIVVPGVGSYGPGVGDNLEHTAGGGMSFLLDLVRGPQKALSALVNKLLGGIGSSWPATAAAGAARSTVSGLVSWAKEKIGAIAGSGGPGRSGKGLPWGQIWAMIKSVVPDARLTSAYRPGAITASGATSMHGLGRAVDFVSRNMRSAALAIRGLLPWTELYHSPLENLQLLNGRPHVPQGITRRMHYDHVHAAYGQGGQIPAGLRGPLVRDRGGPIPPGDWWVRNGTGHTEHVINPKLHELAGGPKVVQHVKVMYPQAEPTSVTTQRTLQYAAALGL